MDLAVQLAAIEAVLSVRPNRSSVLIQERSPDALDSCAVSAVLYVELINLEGSHDKVTQAFLARKKIAGGYQVYKACSGCEDEISDSRLIAVPWAIFCIQCQRACDRIQSQKIGHLRFRKSLALQEVQEEEESLERV